MRPIKLKSSDGKLFKADFDVLKCSSMCKIMLDRSGNFDYKNMKANSQVVLHLPDINSVILAKIIKWAKHHKNDAITRSDEDGHSIYYLCQWDAQFFKMDARSLTDIWNAANHLHIDRLAQAAGWILYRLLGRLPVQHGNTTPDVQADLVGVNVYSD